MHMCFSAVCLRGTEKQRVSLSAIGSIITIPASEMKHAAVMSA